MDDTDLPYRKTIYGFGNSGHIRERNVLRGQRRGQRDTDRKDEIHSRDGIHDDREQITPSDRGLVVREVTRPIINTGSYTEALRLQSSNPYDSYEPGVRVWQGPEASLVTKIPADNRLYAMTTIAAEHKEQYFYNINQIWMTREIRACFPEIVALYDWESELYLVSEYVGISALNLASSMLCLREAQIASIMHQVTLRKPNE